MNMNNFIPHGRKKQKNESPVYITITHGSVTAEGITRHRVEFGFNAAATALAASTAYQKHRLKRLRHSPG